MHILVIDMLKNESHKDVLIVNRDDNSFYAITNVKIFAILNIVYYIIHAGKFEYKFKSLIK